MIVSAMTDAEVAKAQMDRFDALMKLSDFHIERWKVRNTQEWRVPFAIWAILIVSLVSFQRRPPEEVLIATLLAITIGYATLFAFPVAVRNHYEVDRAYRFRDEADAVLLDPATSANARMGPIWEMTKEDQLKLRRRVLRTHTFYFQITTTAALCLLAYWTIGTLPLARTMISPGGVASCVPEIGGKPASAASPQHGSASGSEPAAALKRPAEPSTAPTPAPLQTRPHD